MVAPEKDFFFLMHTQKTLTFISTVLEDIYDDEVMLNVL